MIRYKEQVQVFEKRKKKGEGAAGISVKYWNVAYSRACEQRFSPSLFIKFEGGGGVLTTLEPNPLYPHL